MNPSRTRLGDRRPESPGTDSPPLDEARQLWTQGRVYSLGNLLDRTAAFLLIPILIHELTPNEWGIYALTIVVAQLVRVLPVGILDPFIRLYFDSDEPAERNRVVSTAFGLLLAFGALLAVIAYPLAAGTTSLLFGDRAYTSVFLVANLVAIFTLCFQFELDYLRMLRRPGLFVTSTLVRSLAHLSLSVYLVVVADRGVVGILLGNLVATATVCVPLAGWILVRTGLGFRPSTAREMFRLGLPLAPAWLAKSSLETSERYLVHLLTSTAALGLFSVAYKLADPLRALIVAPVASVWGVRLMEVGDSQQHGRNLQRVLIYVTAVVASGAVTLGLFGSEILDLLAPESYRPVATILPIFALAQLLEPLNVHFEFVILQRKMTRYLPIVSLAAVAVSVIALSLLVPAWGLPGAALAVAAAQIARLVLAATMARRAGSAVTFPWRAHATIVGLAVAATAAGLLLASGRPGLAGAAVKVGVCLAFGAVLLFSPAFTSRERELLTGYCRARLGLGGSR